MHNQIRIRVIRLVLSGLFLFFMVGLLLYLTIQNKIYIPCLFHKITGFFCPGCGITRSILCLLQFDLLGSIHNNLLVIILIPFVFYYVCFLIQFYLKTGKLISVDQVFSQKMIWFFVLGAFLFAILRNFPAFYFIQPI